MCIRDRFIVIYDNTQSYRLKSILDPVGKDYKGINEEGLLTINDLDDYWNLKDDLSINKKKSSKKGKKNDKIKNPKKIKKTQGEINKIYICLQYLWRLYNRDERDDYAVCVYCRKSSHTSRAVLICKCANVFVCSNCNGQVRKLISKCPCCSKDFNANQ